MTDALFSCWIGQTIRLKASFLDPETNSPVDPVPVSITLEAPDRSTATYTYGTDAALQRMAAGVYWLTVRLGMAGPWIVHAEGGADITAVIETEIDVRPSSLSTP